MDIVVVGDINVDLVLSGLESLPALRELKHAKSMQVTLGGSSAIFAHNIARLGVTTAFIGKVGKDRFGDFLLDTLEGAGVDISRVVRDAALPTGICVSMSFPQDYAMVSYPGIRNQFTLAEIDLDGLRPARHLHLSSFYLQPGLQPGCLELFRAAKAAGLTTSLDPDHDPQEKWDGGLRALLPYVDIFLPNELEAMRVSGTQDYAAAVEFFQQTGKTTVIKRGKDGVSVVGNHQIISGSSFRIEPVDITGAGDSFNAGFLMQHLNSAPLQASIVWGNACGALSTQALGGIDAFPTRAQVEAFLAERANEAAAMVAPVAA
jgi:sugar/nucleoside kinase (ribokinase family)